MADEILSITGSGAPTEEPPAAPPMEESLCYKSTLLKVLRDNFAMLMEMAILLVMFWIGGYFLAHYPTNEPLRAWLTGGAVLGAVLRALTGKNGN